MNFGVAGVMSMRVGLRSAVPSTVLLSLLISAAFLPQRVEAQVRVPAIFSDNMVLQSGTAAKIYGDASPEEAVTVSFAGKKVSTKAGKDGHWSVPLPNLQNGTSGTLTVTGTKTTITIKNVLVGEVWLCAGQSNMAFPVEKSTRAKEILSRPIDPEIRLFVIPADMANQPLSDVPAAHWAVCSPQSLPTTSAIAYWFARDLKSELHSPVGIIEAAYGGSAIKTWISKDVLSNDAVRQDKTLAAQLSVEPNSPAKFMEFAIDKDQKERATSPNKPHDLASKFSQPLVPFSLFNAMIAPVTHYSIKGIAWYQGEADAEEASVYARLFPLFINDWRKQFHAPLLPFLFVQLPNFEVTKYCIPTKGAWAALREAQASALTLPATAMTVTIEQGDAHQLHPKKKDVVAHRLALTALEKVYKRAGVQSSGPVFQRLSGKGATLTCQFEHAKGLNFKGSRGSGFEISGSDGKYFAADVTIKNGNVMLSSKSVAKPVAVKYGWANNTSCNLYNGTGLPAAPFRASL